MDHTCKGNARSNTIKLEMSEIKKCFVLPFYSEVEFLLMTELSN